MNIGKSRAKLVGEKQILSDHRDEMETVARELLVRETLDAATFKRLIGAEPTVASTPE